MRPRIRSIKPEALSDEELWDLEQETGLPIFRAWTGLWMFADREGRFEWRPRALGAGILPYWEGDFSRVLDALRTRGFLVQYASAGKLYGLVRTFKRHQAINNKEPKSVLPEPTEETINEAARLRTRAPRVSDATPDTLETSLGERNGKGTEGSGSGIAREAQPQPPPQELQDPDGEDPADLDPDLEPGEPEPPPRPLRAGDVEAAWRDASAGQVFSGSQRARSAFEAWAEALQQRCGEDALAACRAHLHWVFQAPDGAVRAGRSKYPRPWSLLPGLLDDLPRALEWFQSLPDGERERIRNVRPPGAGAPSTARPAP